MLRLAGMAPARIREFKLRSSTRRRMTSCAKQDDFQTMLAPRVFASAINDSGSVIRGAESRCTVSKVVLANASRYQQEIRKKRARSGSRLSPVISEDLQNRIWATATDCAMRSTSWASRETRLKLLKLQTQEYNAPHPVAQLPGADARELARWMTNMIPGGHYPCSGCNGRYNVSRYHVTRCVNAMQLLGCAFNAAMHERHADRTDNPLDSQIIGMVPYVLTRDAIQAARDRITVAQPSGASHSEPRSLRARASDTTPPYANDELKAKVRAIADVLRKIRSNCCRPGFLPDVAAEPDPDLPSQGSIVESADIDGDAHRRNDRVLLSPPVLLPAR